MKVIDRYKLEEVVGSGSYGKVYRSTTTDTNEVFAIKCIPIEKFRRIPKLNQFTKNEIYVLEKLDHPHIVKYVEKLVTVNNTYMVYEFCAGGTLENKIYKSNDYLLEENCLKYFSEMVSALCLLNKYNILHRDIKPENIMLHNDMLKLGDFGFCKPLKQKYDFSQTMVGSPIYMAPELLKSEHYDAKADVWSLGVSFFEMLFKTMPYKANSIQQLISMIDRQKLNIPHHLNKVSSHSENLIRMMLVIEAKQRASFDDVQNYLAGFFPYAMELKKKYNDMTIQISSNELDNIVKFSKYNLTNNKFIQERIVKKYPEKLNNIKVIDKQTSYKKKNTYQIHKQNIQDNIPKANFTKIRPNSPLKFNTINALNKKQNNSNSGKRNYLDKEQNKPIYNYNNYNNIQANTYTKNQTYSNSKNNNTHTINKEVNEFLKNINIKENENLPIFLKEFEKNPNNKSTYSKELILIAKEMAKIKLSHQMNDVDQIFAKRSKYLLLLFFVKSLWMFELENNEENKFLAILMIFKKIHCLILEIKITLTGLSNNCLMRYLENVETFKNTINREIEEFNSFFDLLMLELGTYINSDRPEFYNSKLELNKYEFDQNAFKKHLINFIKNIKVSENNNDYLENEKQISNLLDCLLIEQIYETFGEIHNTVEIYKYIDIVKKLDFNELQNLNCEKLKILEI